MVVRVSNPNTAVPITSALSSHVNKSTKTIIFFGKDLPFEWTNFKQQFEWYSIAVSLNDKPPIIY